MLIAIIAVAVFLLIAVVLVGYMAFLFWTNPDKGLAETTHRIEKLPYVLDQMTHLHKAKSADPLYFLNIFFGLALLFFVISSFWMFMPHTSIFKKGLYFTLAGIVITLILLFV